tara:strand:+ start:127 stop:765 length:639 start_codon:yes stop_codon:yes gene_type:complete
MININKIINNNSFYFDYRKAVFWEEESALITADHHIGKVMHFRKNGSALPNIASSENMIIFKELMDHYSPKKIIFLGDLFHSTYNNEWHEWIEFFKNCSTSFILVKGNHDHDHFSIREIENLQTYNDLKIRDFFLTHYPLNHDGYINLCGHTHPSVKLSFIGNKKVNLPCFHISENRITFPSFGKFTGSHTIQVEDNDLILPIGQNRIFQKF